MKRLFAVLFAIVLMLCVCAYAAEVVEVAADVAQGVEAVVDVAQQGNVTTFPTEPFTWKALGTIAGCTAFALLFVQLIKAPLDNIMHIPTRLVVYVVCLIIMLCSAAFNDGLTPDSAALAIVNAIIPALSAYGAYELTFAKSNT